MLNSRMAIYAATAPIDLRRAFDGLAAAAREELGHDPKVSVQRNASCPGRHRQA